MSNGLSSRPTIPGRALRVQAAVFCLGAALSLLVGPAAAGDRVVAYEIVDASSIPGSMTGRPGDPEAGRKLFFDNQRTGCSGCHGSPSGPGAVPKDGQVEAPRLSRITERLSEGNIRLWIVAPQVISPGTAMPTYYALGQRTDPRDPRYGEPVLSAGEVEDLVAYLVQAAQ